MTEALVAAIEEDRKRVVSHGVYDRVASERALREFMSFHVWAIYDYFLLLKRLQNDLTCTRVPWRPTKDAAMRRFIQEIVLEEESDVMEDGTFGSHLELYLRAMEQMGADTGPMRAWLAWLEANDDEAGALDGDLVPVLIGLGAPRASAEHVASTMDLVRTGSTGEVAAVFAFGREDLIPLMFARLLPARGGRSWLQEFPSSIFMYYLERHIELDGDEHGPLSISLVEGCLGVRADDEETRDNWRRATAAVRKALRMRARLWDAVLAATLAVP